MNAGGRKSIFITGAASGIGAATAAMLRNLYLFLAVQLAD